MQFCMLFSLLYPNICIFVHKLQNCIAKFGEESPNFGSHIVSESADLVDSPLTFHLEKLNAALKTARTFRKSGLCSLMAIVFYILYFEALKKIFDSKN